MSQNAAVKKPWPPGLRRAAGSLLTFQREVWKAIAGGQSGLLHATTGAGKTYAVWLGALMAFMAKAPTLRAAKVAGKPPPVPALIVLWLTPMRRRRRHAARAAATARTPSK